METEGLQTAPRFALPLFINRSNRLLVALVMYVIGAALYLLTNHFHFLEPRLLPMSWVDLKVPFLPNTFWIYNSEYIYFFIVYILCDDMENLNQYVYGLMALQLASAVIFSAWPTTYPRDQFPLPADLNTITAHAFGNLRSMDNPASCCPSLHVSSVYLSAFVYLEKRGAKFYFFLTWGTLIAISTLTTKQHYLIDVVTGFGMAVIFHVLFRYYVRYRAVTR